jgi:hypothetical protein
MTTGSPQEQIACLPRWIQDRIKSCPAKGQGVHPWLFKTALVLHNHFSEDQMEHILSQYVSCDGREREIREAVANSGKYLRGEVTLSNLRRPWPSVDYTTIHKIVLDCPVRLEDLPSISPFRVGTKEPKTEEILDTLFPGNPLLCFGLAANSFSTRPRESWRGRESGFQFIVPNPMIKETGVTKMAKNPSGASKIRDLVAS